jgi:uncharacterized protein YacL
MGFTKWFENLIKKMEWIDVKVIGFIGIVMGYIIIKIFPSFLEFILEMNIWILVLIALILYFRLYYVMFLKKK